MPVHFVTWNVSKRCSSPSYAIPTHSGRTGIARLGHGAAAHPDLPEAVSTDWAAALQSQLLLNITRLQLYRITLSQLTQEYKIQPCCKLL